MSVQLTFRYSTMNAGKSIDALKVAYNYEERGKRPLVMTSALDHRYGVGKIASRIGVERDAIMINDDTSILQIFVSENKKQSVDAIIIDEAQFLKKSHIEELSEIVDGFNIPIICYGLKNDFRNELFEGAYWLLVYADKIEEIKTICWCGRKATMNARVVNGKVIRHGEQVQIGGNELYVPLCRKHYNQNKLRE